MRIGMIGAGAIGRYVVNKAPDYGHVVGAILLRTGSRSSKHPAIGDVRCVHSIADFPDDLEIVLDCAGHAALRTYGPEILRSGSDVATVALGALADQALYAELQRAAVDGKSRLHLCSGAIGALDCLRAARIGELQSVTYTGRKPPRGWHGSPAESKFNLDGLTTGAVTHFSGNAGQAAIEYPKNANVAAAVALAGIGFEQTHVELIADADITDNIHEIQANGEFGSFDFRIHGHSLPDNPRSSALAAMSVLSCLEQQAQPIGF